MSCVCGSLECTCQERCLCTQQDCTCERCDDLRSGRTLGSFEYEDMHTQTSDEKTLHSVLQVSVEEKPETVKDPGAQSLPFNASWHESSVAYSGRIQEAKSSISEKPHESFKSSSSRSSPLSSSKRSPKGYTPVKRSFSSPEDIMLKYFGSTKCMELSTIQSGSDVVVSSDTEATTPVKKIRYIDPSDMEVTPMDVDSSPENLLSPGKKSKCVDSTLFNQCQAISKSSEGTPEPSFSRNQSSDSSYSRFRFPDVVQLSPGRKYTVMISQNILSSSTEPTRSRPSSASATPSNDYVLQTIPQQSLASTKCVPKFDSSQKSCFGLASASCESKSSDGSESTQKSPNVCHHSTKYSRSDSISDISSRRCMPIISPPHADMESNGLDFGSPQRPSSVDSYFDQIRPSSALRASGKLDDMHRMNRVVRQFVVPFEEFKNKVYQHHVGSADEVENLSHCLQFKTPDSAKPIESSASNVGSQTDRETGTEVPTFISGFVQGDPDFDDPFILKGFPHDIASDESNTESGSPPDSGQ